MQNLVLILSTITILFACGKGPKPATMSLKMSEISSSGLAANLQYDREALLQVNNLKTPMAEIEQSYGPVPKEAITEVLKVASELADENNDTAA